MSLEEAKENFVEVIQININAMNATIAACRSCLGLNTRDEKGFPEKNLLELENMMQTTITLVADYRHDPLKFLIFSKLHSQASEGSQK